jgi:flagellar motor switch protein FliN/FliY
MTDRNDLIQELLATALRCAADVAQQRVGKGLQVVEASAPTSTALLRFDLKFEGGAAISWFVSNEDATGFSDMLIGGAGDRGAVLTEMHLDALSGVFSDMLERAVEGLGACLTQPLEAGGVDMGMESGIPSIDNGGAGLVLALQIEGFGLLTVVEHANEAMVQLLRRFAPERLPEPAPQPTGGTASAHTAAPPVQTPGDVAVPAAADPAPANPAPTQSAVPVDVPAPGSFEPPAHVPGPAPGTVGGAPVEAATYDNVVQLPNLTDRSEPPMKSDLRMLLNVPLQVTVELGRTDRTVRQILEMNVGSILELSKLAGDPMDIMVNGQVLARGEVVVIDEEFGVRVTEILDQQDRLRRLG